MKKNKTGINWSVRVRNPIFWVQIVLAALTPILAYVGLSWDDLTTWGTLAELIQHAYSNPYLLGLIVVSIFNSITDPTVAGVRDSKDALKYEKPKSNEQ